MSNLKKIGLILFLLFSGVSSVHATSDVVPFYTKDLPIKDDATVGRHVYVGPAPRFEPEDLQMVISKMGLTLRVTAWVRQDLPDTYLSFLMTRWNRLRKAFQDPSMRILSWPTTESLKREAKTKDLQTWLDVAAPFMQSFFKVPASEQPTNDDYVTSVLSALTLDQVKTLSEGDALFAQISSGTPLSPNLVALSRALFTGHMGPRFTADISRGPAYSGYLTFVYPIAATTAGPFSEPQEGLWMFGLPQMNEARWWSDRWADEFGGFPFLVITPNEVAFHGPITNIRQGADVWFLRRGYVSHGCHRMGPSDVMELRALLPADLANLVRKKRGIPLYILNWLDVTDWNKDGSPEVIDVSYYGLPSNVGLARSFPKTLEEQRRVFWNYRANNFFPKSGMDTKLNLDTYTFSNLPKFRLSTEVGVEADGAWGEVGLSNFPAGPTRILEYHEEGVLPAGYDDRAGRYPPEYFVKF